MGMVGQENEAMLLHHRLFLLILVGLMAPGALAMLKRVQGIGKTQSGTQNVGEQLLLCNFLGFEDARCPCSSHRGSCCVCDMPIGKDKGKTYFRINSGEDQKKWCNICPQNLFEFLELPQIPAFGQKRHSTEAKRGPTCQENEGTQERRVAVCKTVKEQTCGLDRPHVFSGAKDEGQTWTNCLKL